MKMKLGLLLTALALAACGPGENNDDPGATSAEVLVPQTCLENCAAIQNDGGATCFSADVKQQCDEQCEAETLSQVEAFNNCVLMGESLDNGMTCQENECLSLFGLEADQ